MTALMLAVALQVGGSADTLSLAEAHRAATSSDPRVEQIALQRDATRLRVANLRTERLPSLAIRGDATVQSDVVEIPFEVPGFEFPELPRERFQATVNVDQRVYDGGRLAGQEAVEEARLAELEAEVAARMFPVRMEVNEAYFGALLAQSRQQEIALLIQELEARQTELRVGVAAGAVLPGDTAMVRAESLSALQALEEAEAQRSAFVAVLSRLTELPLTGTETLVVPELEEEVAALLDAGGADRVRLRPEFERIAAAIARIGTQQALVAARGRPQLRAFGMAGVGRPGPYQLFDDGINDFWQAGVRLEWQPWRWGSGDREAELLRIEQEGLRVEEATLADELGRRAESELAAMERLRVALARDDRIIELREEAEAPARLQLQENAITAADYVARRLDVVEARLSRERHQVELQAAYARYLTLLGAFPTEEDR